MGARAIVGHALILAGALVDHTADALASASLSLDRISCALIYRGARIASLLDGHGERSPSGKKEDDPGWERLVREEARRGDRMIH